MHIQIESPSYFNDLKNEWNWTYESKWKKNIPVHVGAVLNSPVPSSSSSWHVRVALPLRWNPSSQEAVHVSSKSVLAPQSVLPSVIVGGESHVIAGEK